LVLFHKNKRPKEDEMAKRLLLLSIVTAVTILFFLQAPSVVAQKPDDFEVWLEEDWEGGESVVILAMKMAPAGDLPQADTEQCARLNSHLLEDAEHMNRIPLIREILTGLATGTLVADQLGFSGARGIAFVRSSEGKALLIWGASTVPTAFSGFDADYVRKELERVGRVDPTSGKARQALAAVAACLLRGVPEEAPVPVPLPTRETAAGRFPGFQTTKVQVAPSLVLAIVLICLLLIGGAKALAR
jgi:hypothetical protein